MIRTMKTMKTMRCVLYRLAHAAEGEVVHDTVHDAVVDADAAAARVVNHVFLDLKEAGVNEGEGGGGPFCRW
jgi:hypothetical protein